MANITQSVPMLTGGVSEQAPSHRLPTQVSNEFNCLNSLTHGVKKRPNSIFVSELQTNSQLDDAYIHFITRDNTEKYIVAISDSGIEVFNRDTGYKYDVVDTSQGSYLTLQEYVGSKRQQYAALTSADTTFVLNKTVPVKRLNRFVVPSVDTDRVEVTIATLPKSASPYQKGGYRIDLDGSVAVSEFENVSASEVASKLMTAIQAKYGSYTYRLVANKIYIDMPKGSPMFTLTDNSFTYKFEAGNQWYTQVSASVLSVVTGDAPINTKYVQPRAVVFLRQTDYSVKYEVKVNGQTVSQTTADATVEDARATLKTTSILSVLANAINNLNNGVSASLGNGYIELTAVDDFTVSVSDDLNNKAIGVVKDKVQLFSDLPSKAPDGFKINVVGSMEDEGFGYWVEFKQTGEDGQGHWEESTSPYEVHELDKSTMPHTLIRKQDNAHITPDNPYGIYFEFGEGKWQDREIGDDIAAPFPSFVSLTEDESDIVIEPRTIQGLGYYKNRLVFTSGENVVLSESGNYWNFFRTTTQTVRDSDRIDITAQSRYVNPISAVVSANDELLIFGTREQFALRSGDIFSPNTVYADSISTYSISEYAVPTFIGSSVYFAVQKGGVNGIYERLVLDSGSKTEVELNQHCPTYINGSVLKIVGSKPDGVIFIQTLEADGQLSPKLYVYNFVDTSDGRALSAFNKWIFYDTIVSVDVTQSVMTILIKSGDKYIVDEIRLNADQTKEETGVSIVLDSLRESDTPINNQTPVVTYNGKSYTGYTYTQYIELSEIFYRDRNNLPILNGRLQLRHIELSFNDTTQFIVTVEQKGRDARVYSYEGRRTGDLLSRIGTIPQNNGKFRIPVLGKSTDAKVVISNPSEFSSSFMALEWTGNFNARSMRT
jgi:hypothetical protein